MLEEHSLGISVSGTYTVISTLHKFDICLTMQDHQCIFNTALNQVDKIEWFMYVLFAKDLKLIIIHIAL